MLRCCMRWGSRRASRNFQTRLRVKERRFDILDVFNSFNAA